MIDLVSLWVGRVIVYGSIIAITPLLAWVVVMELFGIVCVMKYYWYIHRFRLKKPKLENPFALAWFLAERRGYEGIGWYMKSKYCLPFFYKKDSYEDDKSRGFERQVARFVDDYE